MAKYIQFKSDCPKCLNTDYFLKTEFPVDRQCSKCNNEYQVEQKTLVEGPMIQIRGYKNQGWQAKKISSYGQIKEPSMEYLTGEIDSESHLKEYKASQNKDNK